ncbi:MAG: AraD1 family protein [Janthinobacterium lividum]
MSLIQLTDLAGQRVVVTFDEGGDARLVVGATTTYALTLEAIDAGASLADIVVRHGLGETVDVEAASASGRVLSPIDHPDPAHLLLTGTGLTHLGSADGRDKMHKAAAAGQATDSMRMFLMGVENGKPTDGQPGVAPEWFYKGDGSSLVAPGAPLPSPAFAADAGEEPEIAGIYVNGPDGTPYRVGFAIGNEFSDHVTERQNYLWLAHSKLRPASLGGELLVGELPADVRGTSRIERDGEVLWEKPFASGEQNMSHTIANLEHHHFKYSLFRRPGDVHVHFFGTATLSVSDGIVTQDGDVFVIQAEPFRLTLRNPVSFDATIVKPVVPRAL